MTIISTIRLAIASAIAGVSIAKLQRDLAAAERRALHESERRQRAEAALRSYEWFGKSEVRA